MSVLIDGPTVAALFYSHSNSLGNQEGFLFGQVLNHVKDHISDSQISNSQVQTYIHVSSHLPWQQEDQLYNRGGTPIMEKIAALVGERRKGVVGWYSFRRNSCLRMTMKEQTLHKMLAAKLCPQSQEDFIFFLCTATENFDHSTHSMDHFFVKGVAGNPAKVPVTVLNLGDTMHTEYKTHGNATIIESSSLKSILKKHKTNFVSESGQKMLEMARIGDMFCSLSSSLKTLCGKLIESEQMTGALEEEVQHLQQELNQQELKQQEMKKLRAQPPTDTELLPTASEEIGIDSLTSGHQVFSSPLCVLDNMSLLEEVNRIRVRKMTDASGLPLAGKKSHKKEENTSKAGLSIDEILSVDTLDLERANTSKDFLQPAKLVSNDSKEHTVSLVSVQTQLVDNEKTKTTNDTERKQGNREQKKSECQFTASVLVGEPSDHFRFVENMLSSSGKTSKAKEADGEAAAGRMDTAAFTSGPAVTRLQAKEEAKQPATRSRRNKQVAKSASTSTVTPTTISRSSVPPDVSSNSYATRKARSIEVQENRGPPPSCTKSKEVETGRAEKQQVRGGQHEQNSAIFSDPQVQHSKQESQLTLGGSTKAFKKQDGSGEPRSNYRSGQALDTAIHENGMNKDENEQNLPRSSSPVF